MPYIVMGTKVGEDELLPIAAMFVDDQRRLMVKAEDPEVRDGLIGLAVRWLDAGGFIAHVGRTGPNEEQPEIHESYALVQRPGEAHFDVALDSVVSRYWTGERVGDYEINGFASHFD